MANIKDFAVGLVVTAPSPATSGNTATLRPGEAAEMPVPPFYAVAAPQGQLITRGTSEKILVTAVDTVTDIITFTRNQGNTGAKSIAQNWIIANTIFADDVTNSNMLFNQPVIGTPNGALKIFTTAVPFSSIIVYRNGMRLTPGPGNDYTVTNNTTITFNTAPASGAVITVDQVMGSSLMINGSNSWMPYEIPPESRNGTLKLFSTGRPYIPGTLQVYKNGLLQANGVHVFETNPATGAYTMDNAPTAFDNFFHSYQFVLSVSANSDTVDGYHANNTPTAGTILPLDSNARLNPSVIGTKFINSEFTVTGARFVTSSATYVDITNATMTYTAGTTNERVMLHASVMALKGTGQEGQVILLVNGVQMGPELYYNPGTSNWVRMAVNAVVPLAANQTVTIKLQARSIGGGTFDVLTEVNQWKPKITGVVAAEV